MASCEAERCSYCGAAPCVGDDCPSNFPDWVDDLDEYDGEDDEAVGSCDVCDCNLYRGDHYGGMCEQCAWGCGWFDEDDDDDA